MIDPPPSLTAQNLPESLKFRLILHMVKDDWPSPINCPGILPEILKYRLSLHIVKDDWPSPINCPRILPEIVKFRLSLHKVKDDGPPTFFDCPEFTRNF